ncbi:MAG: hypothetical protein KatS3mg104_2190 [Phycisphaerae bacterium]|nr:MAG: hypothetical protein KatS3mg104_2190 [Phycisphaerae bacterium]
MMFQRLWVGLCVGMLVLTSSNAQETASREPPVVLDATETESLKANQGKMAVVTGNVTEAAWSRSGKVMNIRFENAPGFLAVVFERNRKSMDEAFNGDLAKTLTGSTVKLRGKLRPYGGHDPSFKDATQMILTSSSQITILPNHSSTQPDGSQAVEK